MIEKFWGRKNENLKEEDDIDIELKPPKKEEEDDIDIELKPPKKEEEDDIDIELKQ